MVARRVWSASDLRRVVGCRADHEWTGLDVPAIVSLSLDYLLAA